ncbi:uncharacterized protein LOC102704533 [Oryza brachyantha]|uniref:uncharacterized protein LOC102704533 n=1 Tax=Oryza brachyantha TaxID=4533 RepID=UPI001AD9BC98|nr:uncharacterized protein LOC102704533 [Oryza brachyantha]
MGLSRRFLNLIVERELRCIDMARCPLFHHPPLPTAATVANTEKTVVSVQDSTTRKPFVMENDLLLVERLQLPDPTFSFGAEADDECDGCGIDCFPLADRKVACVDQSGRAFLFDADTRQLVTMPSLHRPKRWPFSLFVPSTDHGDGGGGGGSLYIMEKSPRPEDGRCSSTQPSDQFEAFVYRKPTATASCKSWHRQLLPPPPFVRDHAYSQTHRQITSYAVVGDDVLVSAQDAGSYCLDTAKNAWSRVGEWTLPFLGKVEYVPELKLWFGLSAEDGRLAAADLSAMDTQPELVGSWKELDPCREWHLSRDPQLVNLGSGRFCVARFFVSEEFGGEFGNKLVEQDLVILTGVEVAEDVNAGDCSGSGNGKLELRMTTHKSRFHLSNDRAYISAVF